MTVFNSVLVPLSARFVPVRALRAAAAAGGTLTLLHVIDVGSDASANGSYTLLDRNDAQTLGHYISRVVGDALAIVSEHGAVASVFIALGGPVHTVVRQVAEAFRSEVIVIGTRDHRGVSRMLSECDIPILVVSEPKNAYAEKRRGRAWRRAPQSPED